MNEAPTRQKILELFKHIFGAKEIEWETHPRRRGWPDLLILTPVDNWRLEIKRDWNDEPKEQQKYMIKRLKQFGYQTGYVIYNDKEKVLEYKAHWGGIPIELEFYIQHYML